MTRVTRIGEPVTRIPHRSPESVRQILMTAADTLFAYMEPQHETTKLLIDQLDELRHSIC